jgi:putative tricarboxylic transport membrane protein
MKLSDLIAGLLFIVAGIGIAFEAQSFPALSGQPYGSTFFPTLIGIAMALGGGILSGSAIVRGKTLPLILLSSWLKSFRGIGSFIFILVSLFFYMIFSDRLGFCLTAFTLILVLQKWMGARWFPATFIAFAATALFYVIFSVLLRVPLPYGVVERFF